LDQERERATGLARNLSDAARMEASQASAKRALDDERRKAGILEQELTTARRTIAALRTGANLAAVGRADAVKDRQVAEAASRQAGETLEREHERADSAVRELDIVRKERDALKQNSTELSAALDQERERATGLARSLTAARDVVKDKRRTVAVRAPKAHVTAGASTSSHSGAQTTRKLRLQEKQKVKDQKSPQSEMLATIDLPAALLPRRPPKKLDPGQ